MSKRLIASIHSSIAKLEKKIAATQEDLDFLKLQRDRQIEMLALAEPAPSAPKAGDTGVTTLEEIFETHTGEKLPHFLGKKHHADGEAA